MTRRKTPQIIGETEIANRLGKFGEIRHPHNELKMIHRVIDGARAEVIQRRAEMAEKRERYPTRRGFARGGFKYLHAAVAHPSRRGPTPMAQNEPATEPSAMTAASATRAPM